MKFDSERLNQLLHVCPITIRDIFSTPGPSFPGLPSSDRKHGMGWFRYINNVPVLSLKGNAREIGRQQGTLLREQIRSFTTHYLSSTFGNARSTWRDLRKRANGCKEFIPDRYLNELQGIARAAEVNPELLLCASVFLDFYSLILCSCIAVSPERTRNGEFMVGRNLDFPSMGAAHRMTLVNALDPDDHYQFAYLTWPGLTGVLTGMNEHGLTLALAEVDGTRPFGLGLPYALMQRRILEECRTVTEAEDLLRRMPRTRSNNLLLADADGNAAVFEYDRSTVVRRNPEDGWVYATNHFVSEQHDNRVFSVKYLSAIHRYRKIRRTEQRHASISELQLNRLLAELALGRLNLASMLFFPKKQRMKLRIGAPPAARRTERELDLTQIFADQTSQAPADQIAGKRR